MNRLVHSCRNQACCIHRSCMSLRVTVGRGPCRICLSSKGQRYADRCMHLDPDTVRYASKPKYVRTGSFAPQSSLNRMLRIWPVSGDLGVRLTVLLASQFNGRKMFRVSLHGDHFPKFGRQKKETKTVSNWRRSLDGCRSRQRIRPRS